VSSKRSSRSKSGGRGGSVDSRDRRRKRSTSRRRSASSNHKSKSSPRHSNSKHRSESRGVAAADRKKPLSPSEVNNGGSKQEESTATNRVVENAEHVAESNVNANNNN